MVNHDLAITGGGITAFEANASGLPAIVIANEIFEEQVGRHLDKLGGTKYAGHHTEFIDFSLDIPRLSIEEMSKLGIKNIELDGVKNVVGKILEL